MSRAKRQTSEQIQAQIDELKKQLEVDKKRQAVEPLQAQLFELLLADEQSQNSVKNFVNKNLDKFNKAEKTKLARYYDWINIAENNQSTHQ